MYIHTFVHINPPPFLVLSFKCAEIDVLGYDVNLLYYIRKLS